MSAIDDLRTRMAAANAGLPHENHYELETVLLELDERLKAVEAKLAERRPIISGEQAELAAKALREWQIGDYIYVETRSRPDGPTDLCDMRTGQGWKTWR